MNARCALVLWWLCVACRAAESVDVSPALPPVELAYSGPPMEVARAPSGLWMGRVLAGEPGVFAFKLALPGGSLMETAGNEGAASLLAGSLRRAATGRYAGMPPELAMLADHEGVVAALSTLGVELTVQEDLEALVFEADGPAAAAGMAVIMTCALAFDPVLDETVVEEARDELMSAVGERQRGSLFLAEDVLRSVLFADHPLSRPVLPSATQVEGLPLSAVQRMHMLTAQSSRSLLLVGGGDEAVLDHALKQGAFYCVTPGPPAAPRVMPPLPPLTPQGDRPWRVAVITEAEPNAFVRLGGRAPPPGTPEAVALSVVLESMSNAFSSTLVRELRGKRGLVYGVEGMVRGVARGGWWSMGTSTSPQHAAQVASVMESALNHLHRHGLEGATWSKVARASALGFPFGREVLAELLNVELDGWMMGRGPREAWKMPAWLWKVSQDAEWANRVVHPFLEPSTSVLVVVGPREALAGQSWDEMHAADDWPEP